MPNTCALVIIILLLQYAQFVSIFVDGFVDLCKGARYLLEHLLLQNIFFDPVSSDGFLRTNLLQYVQDNTTHLYFGNLCLDFSKHVKEQYFLKFVSGRLIQIMECKKSQTAQIELLHAIH